ncbi:NTP transferase domain-containing protein [Candidatus Peregrinibacteria bacterium]|nr:NTP transferase domain-containing protein [Candidatus Peregrinibacteria bacterium]
MDPLSDKNFLEFLGKPLIEHQCNALKNAGFQDFILIGGAHNLARLKAFADAFCRKHHVSMSITEQKNLETGMAGAVLSVRDFVQDEPICIVSSNDVVDESAYQLLSDAAQNKDFDSFLIGKKVSRYFPGGYMQIRENDKILGREDGHLAGQIQKIVEKPGQGNEPSDMVNLVLHVHKKPQVLFDFLAKTQSAKDDLYEVALDNMIQSGVKMMAVPYEGFWQAIKYPWHVFSVAKLFFEKSVRKIHFEAVNTKISQNGSDAYGNVSDSSGSHSIKSGDKNLKNILADGVCIAESAIIKGDVIIEEGVRIFDGAVINGPVYLGANTIVANHALVRDSYIGRNCVVGFSTEVARSYLGNDVWMHTNYIGDSIISDNCSFGSGAVLANLRLDEKAVSVDIQGKKVECESNKIGAIIGANVRVGVNTSIMPGVKIGSESFIASGIVVSQDIPEKSFVRGVWDLKISENRGVIAPDAREKMRKKI